MKPMLASLLEAMEDQPSSLDGHVISSAASMAISHIRNLENALTGIMRGAPHGSHAKLTAAAALDLIGEDGPIRDGHQ